jgi:hypothetical protein
MDNNWTTSNTNQTCVAETNLYLKATRYICPNFSSSAITQSRGTFRIRRLNLSGRKYIQFEIRQRNSTSPYLSKWLSKVAIHDWTWPVLAQRVACISRASPLWPWKPTWPWGFVLVNDSPPTSHVVKQARGFPSYVARAPREGAGTG